MKRAALVTLGVAALPGGRAAANQCGYAEATANLRALTSGAAPRCANGFPTSKVTSVTHQIKYINAGPKGDRRYSWGCSCGETDDWYADPFDRTWWARVHKEKAR